MTQHNFRVCALPFGSVAGRGAFDTVYGDFVRLISIREDFQYDPLRIREEIRVHAHLQNAAQAFLTVFDRYRAFLSYYGKTGIPKKLLNRLFQCPPSGVIMRPVWPYDYQCRHSVVCPWCRHRLALEHLQRPWAPLDETVHLYRRVYEVFSFQKLKEARDQASRERHAFRRWAEDPFIRFQRVGLEMVGGQAIYRLLQLLVFRQPQQTPKGVDWHYCSGTYEHAVNMAFRYSAVNLMRDQEWDKTAALLHLYKFRTAETSR